MFVFKYAVERFFCLAVVGLSLVLFSHASADAQDYTRYYFKQPQTLQRNTSKVAIFANQNSDAIEAAVASHIGQTKVDAHSIAGWHLIDVEGQDTEGFERTLDELLELNGIGFVAPVFFDDLGGPFIPTQDILVRFNEDVTHQRQMEVLADLNIGGIQTERWANMSNAFCIRSGASNGSKVLEQANSLARLPEVRWAEPDMIFTGRNTLIPNDEFFADSWGLHNVGQIGDCQSFPGLADMDMDASEAWDITIGDEDIIVLVIDTGGQQDHPDLNQVPGMDFTNENGDGGPFNQCDNHGTPVAGCVSATINNNIGGVGVAPGCRTASARCFVSNLVCNGSWSSQFSWGADALAWAETMGVRVTNNSNQYGGSSAALADKYAQTRDDGMIHFASAGNGTSPIIVYPSSLESVNAIAALNPAGGLASFSNFGVGIAFSAPGEDILTTDRTGFDGWINGDYVCANGTSFASPYAAGVAALVLSVNPSLNALEVEQVMQASSVDLGQPGYDLTFGWGFVNAHQAVLNAQTCNGNLIGDLNGDGEQNLLDVAPFVAAITSGEYVCEADINQDNNVDLLDVSGFVDLLSGI